MHKCHVVVVMLGIH